MNINSAMRSSAAGLSAERFRMDVISTNIANSNSTETRETRPYRRQEVVISATPDGPKVMEIQDDRNTPFRQVHQPGNPLRDADGNVEASNVEPILEMENMMSASRAYEANVAAFNTAKTMAKSALSTGKV